MSLEKEDLRLKMLPDMMERLRLISDVRGKDYAHQAVILLEKAIMGEYHEVSLMLERAEKNRKKRERLGLLGKIGVNPESQILEIKKPDGRDQASRHSIEVDQMNTNNLSEQPIELNSPDFLIGDVVVLTKECRTFKSNDLFEVKNKTLTRLWTIKSENHLILVSSKEIRTATVAELNAKRRLTKAEQALAEVS